MDGTSQRIVLRAIKKNSAFYLFISPFFILFAIFGLYPLLFSLYLSFVKWDGLTTMNWVGLGNFVKFDKPGGFIGREALLKLKKSGYRYLMPQFLLEDPEPMLYYGEIIYRNGTPVGNVMAGGYGHTLGAAVGVGPVENNGDIVTADYVTSGSYEIDIAGTRYPAKVSLRPMYDPDLKRVRS